MELECESIAFPLISTGVYGFPKDKALQIAVSVFSQFLLEDVWKRANLDRKHFSKIQCDKNYHPKKKTVMALCIALQLDLEQSRDLLAGADWAFSPSSKVDLIVQKAIIDKQYDIMQLNVTLFKYTNEILGV